MHLSTAVGMNVDVHRQPGEFGAEACDNKSGNIYCSLQCTEFTYSFFMISHPLFEIRRIGTAEKPVLDALLKSLD